MSNPIIQISHLKNWLGEQWIHQDVNFTVNQREVVGIIGGSGAGKTVLLRSMLMLHQPTAGSIKIFGQEVIGCTAKQALAIQHRWGVMFQHSALFSSLTVLENVTFPLKLFTKLSKTMRREIGMLKIALAGLSTDAANKFPSELSGGMQKRAALARAIAMDPELLFLDEPTSGLDPHSASAFDELILNLRETLQLTVVMITHDVDSLWHTTDKVAFLGEGQMLAVDKMNALIHHPHPQIQAYFSGIRGQRGEASGK